MLPNTKRGAERAWEAHRITPQEEDPTKAKEGTELFETKNAEWLKPPSQGTDQIDKKTLEISKADDEVYTDLSILGEELPDHSPRFILLSYPLTMVCCLSVLLVHLLACTDLGTRADLKEPLTGFRSSIRSLRHAILPACHLQQRAQDALRGSKGVDAQPGRSRSHHRDRQR